jgi:homoserine kinase type II
MPVLNDNPSEEEKFYADKSLELAKRISKTQLELYNQLTHKLTHGDYWDNNVFMKDLEVSYVIDFDFFGKRARIDDIAYTLFSKIHGEYSEESIGNIKAVLDCYDEVALSKLSKSERKAIPLSMARVPLAFIGIIASLDTRDQMSNELKSRKDSIDWSIQLLDNLEFWQNSIVS